MIASLKGQVLNIEKETLVIEVNNIGYEVFCSQHLLSQVVEGESLRLFIFNHVREDQFTLFGFLDALEKKLFLSLIKVNGIGPKVALAILSAATVESLLEMIESGNVKKLSSLPRIGKKKAEQIILSLKGKLILADTVNRAVNKNKTEISGALVHLGFKALDVEKVVSSFSTEIEVDEGVREGLKQLTGTL